MSKARKDGSKNPQEFMTSLNSCFEKVKVKIKEAEKKKKIEKERRKKIEEDYNNWLEKQKPEAEKAAWTILEWLEKFLTSDVWKEITLSLRSLKRDSEGSEELIINYLDISGNVIYKGPSSNPYHPYGSQGYQSLILDLSGNILVSNNVKYGKSHMIHSFTAMIKYVDPIVLIKVAETIQDDSIWTIIQERLKERLRKSVSGSKYL